MRAILTVLVVSACAQGPKPVELDPACKRDALEADAMSSPWLGAGVVDGGLPAPAAGAQYVISTTYLALQPEKETLKLFNESMAPVVASLPTQDGLIAYRLSSSEHCVSARTLTVWRDVNAMQRFSAADAHRNAMVLVGDLSRGGSQVTHWTGDETAATWEVARAQLEAAPASQY